jgi:hypothetical protein
VNVLEQRWHWKPLKAVGEQGLAQLTQLSPELSELSQKKPTPIVVTPVAVAALG